MKILLGVGNSKDIGRPREDGSKSWVIMVVIVTNECGGYK